MPPPPPPPWAPQIAKKNMHFGPDMKDWFSIVFPYVYYVFTVMRSVFADILVSPVPMDFMYRPAGPPKIKTEKCFLISRGAEGPGREILQRPPSVRLSVRLSVRPSVCPSHLVFAL